MMNAAPSIIAAGLCGAIGWACGWTLATQLLEDDSDVDVRSASVKTPAVWEESGDDGQDSGRGNPLKTLLDEDAPEFERLTAVALLGDGPAQGSFANQLLELEALNDWQVKSEAIGALMQQWLAAAPQDAFAHVLRTRANSRNLQFNKLITEWARVDPEAAIAAVQGIEEGSALRDSGIQQITDTIADSKPEMALELMLTTGRFRKPVFTALARIDVQRALSEAEKLTTSFDQVRAVGTVVAEWAKSDVEAALRYARESSNNRIQLIRAVVTSIAERDKPKSLALIEENLNGSEANSAHHDVMEEWAKEAPLDALTYFQSMDDGSKKDEIRADLSMQLVNSGHPDRALEVFLGGKRPDHDTSELFNNWADSDWDGAAAAALELKDPKVRSKAAEGLLKGLFKAQPDTTEATEWAMALMDIIAESGGGENLHLGWSIGYWKPETVTALVENYPQLLQESIADAFEGMKDLDSARTVFESIDDQNLKDRALQPLAANWAKQDPAGTADWLATLPEGEGKTLAYGNVANAWARADPGAAREWIENLEPSAPRDTAIAHYVGIYGGSDPKNSLKLAQSITSEKERNQALRNSLEAWLATDFDAALETIADMDIPEAIADHVTKAAKQEEAWQRIGGED